MRYFTRVDWEGTPRSLHRFDADAGISNRFDKAKGEWVDDPYLIAFTGIGGDNNYFELPAAQVEDIAASVLGEKAAALALRGITVSPGLRRIIVRGGPGSGHYGHEGRPGEVGGSAPGAGDVSGGAPGGAYVAVSEKDALAVGKKDTEWNGKGFMQPSGSPIRGEYISLDDPRIPDTVYHMTTNMSGKEERGVINREGMAKGTGLGGDQRDQMVSLTLDEDVAANLASDMRFVSQMAQEFSDLPARVFDEEAKRWTMEEDGRRLSDEEIVALQDRVVERINALDPSRPASFEYESHGGGVAGESVDTRARLTFGVKDELGMYFLQRERAGGPKNPVLFGDMAQYARLDPANIGYIAIPKDNLRTGALVTNFDLDNSVGLREIRLYGSLPLQGATFIRSASAVTRGGPGSGHFGHEGRPGEVGGSAPGGGGSEAQISQGRDAGLRSATELLRVPRTVRWQAVREASEAINEVHGLPSSLQAVKVVEIKFGASRLGRLIVDINRRTGEMNVRNLGVQLPREGEEKVGIAAHPSLTAAHEFGHYLDWTVFATKTVPSGDWGESVGRPEQGSRGLWYQGLGGDDLTGVMTAIKGSDTYSQLENFQSTALPWPGDDSGAKLVYDHQTVRYLREPQELFARGYAQWVAERSGNEDMLRGVEDYRAAARLGHAPQAWEAADFEPIGKAFDDLFQRKGWR